jgi:hypothetical protein
VADDEMTPGGTANELLAAVAGVGTVDGLLLEDRVVPVSWVLDRGEGSARWVESAAVSHTTRTNELGFGNAISLGDPDCHDRLELPVFASVQVGGEVDVSLQTIAESRPDRGGVVPRVWGGGSYDDATFPAVPGVDPADFDDKTSFIVLEGLDGATVHGRAGWEGSETESSSSAFYVVEFPVPAQ